MLMTWRAGSMIGAPLMRPDSFRNAITEPVKVSAPMATPSDISMRLEPWMCAGRADVEGVGRVERAGRDQHRGQADQRVEGGDQLRHRGHRHAARDHGADAAADGDAEDNQQPGDAVRRRMAGERGARPRSPCRPCRRNCPGGDDAGLDSPRSDRMNSTPATR